MTWSKVGNIMLSAAISATTAYWVGRAWREMEKSGKK